MMIACEQCGQEFDATGRDMTEQFCCVCDCCLIDIREQQRDDREEFLGGDYDYSMNY